MKDGSMPGKKNITEENKSEKEKKDQISDELLQSDMDKLKKKLDLITEQNKKSVVKH